MSPPSSLVMPPLLVIAGKTQRESDLSVLVRAGRAVSGMALNVAAERPGFVHLEERVGAR